MKFTRAALRDFPDQTDEMNDMFDLLITYAAKLKRRTDIQASEHKIISDNSEIIYLPVTNAHIAIIRLIRQKLNANDVDSFRMMNDIAEFYMCRFFEYSDMIDSHREIENWDLINLLLATFSFEISCNVGYLEYAMKIHGIEYNEIII